MNPSTPVLDPLDQIEALLLEAAARRTAQLAPEPSTPAPTPTRRRRWRFRGGRRPLALLAVLVIGGSAVAATEPWKPLLGSSKTGHATTTLSPLSSADTSVLGVLRRPQDANDRGPAVQADLGLIGRVNHGVYTAFIRYLGPGANGHAVALFPLRRFGDDEAGPPEYTVDNVLCVVYPLAGGGSAYPCFTIARVKQGTAVAGAAGAGGYHVFGLVPDGVAQVVAHFTDGTTAVATVHNNFFDIPSHNVSPRFALGTEFRWLTSSGATRPMN